MQSKNNFVRGFLERKPNFRVIKTVAPFLQTTFDAPGGTDPVALDLGSMGKGQAWINGHHLGRYFLMVAPQSGCETCDYRGAYNTNKCRTNCGEPSQRWQVIHFQMLAKSLLVVSSARFLQLSTSCQHPFTRVRFSSSMYVLASRICMFMPICYQVSLAHANTLFHLVMVNAGIIFLVLGCKLPGTC